MTSINMDQIKKTIGEKIYPEERYPRSLFPNLISTLGDLFKNNDKMQDNGDLEDRIYSLVNLKSLLIDHPGVLVIIYKDLIYKYIFKRHTNKEEVEEIVQEIITRVLKDKIQGIRKRFDFGDPELPTFTSYFLVTIRNIYIDIIRRESRGKDLVDNECEIEILGDSKRRDMLTSLILEEEFRKFNTLIKLYHNTAPKLKLTLKMKFNIPVDESDIVSCFPGCSKRDKSHLLKQKELNIKNRENMEMLTPFFNKYEGKSNNPDTLRKWITSKLEELKRQMNHVHPEKPYNNSTISDLIILYFKWKKGGGV